MKYDVSGRKRNPECKNIGAFYGLNRTGKINDFQFSDMENMDAGSFPFVETRRERSVFWGAGKEEQPMQMICSDTDVYDDYKLTGVTDSGGFVYRGKKYLEEGYDGNVCMLEHMGDYVFLPSKKVVTVNSDDTVSETDFEGKTDGFLGDYVDVAYSITEYTSRIGETFAIGKNSMRAFYSCKNAPNYEREYAHFFFEHARPGQVFTLDLLCRSGYGMDEIEHEYRCDIPDDVYMVMDRVYYNANGTEVSYGDADFSESAARDFWEDLNGKTVNLYIEFTARRKLTGEIYDISRHFQYYHSYSNEITPGDSFLPGLAYVELGGAPCRRCWNDFHVNLFSSDVMLFGASFGGRLFTCDNLGITVYFSASGSYDFEAGDSLGGAGFVSCAEPGKWVAMCVYNEALYVFKRNGMYRIYSGDGLTYYLDRIADVGAIDREGVCVVDNVLYFLSDNGIYQFTGSYPQPLPDSLGRRYTAGTLGGDDGKLFASLEYKEGGEEKHELIVWHSDKQIFSRHDDFCAKQFLAALGGVYALAKDGTVMKMEGDRCALPFSLTTKKYFFGFSKKGANGAQIYFDFEGKSFEVLVSHDGGEFVPCSVVSDGRVRYIPVRFRKCDELMLRIQGEGIFTLKGISFLVYQGGNVKQNHMIKW